MDKNSTTLGLSFGYHDAAAALVRNGAIVVANQEDRYTRQKHDPNFPTYSIEFCLKEAGLTIDQVDRIIFHENPYKKFSRVLASSFYSYPFSFNEFKNAMKSWVSNKLWAVNTISKRLDIDPNKIKFLDHHFSHACNAFIGSGFDKSNILVVDAVGDWNSTCFYTGQWVDGKPQVEKVQEIRFPHSLGLVYSAVTEFIGFTPNSSECSTMALAAFGNPTFLPDLEKIVQFEPDGTYRVDQSYFNFTKFYSGGVTQKFLDVFGEPRKGHHKYNFNCFSEPTAPSADDQRFADLACSVQRLFEKALLHAVEELGKNGIKNLCFSGGGALNCVANSQLSQSTNVEHLYIPPDPGDGGSAIGAALYGNFQEGAISKSPADHRYSPYQGEHQPAQVGAEMIGNLNPKKIQKYLGDLSSGVDYKKFEVELCDSKQQLVEKASTELMNRKILGWVQGRNEIGPRALGNRSILIRPDDIELAKKLSLHVKERAFFRPYALSVSEGHAEEYFDFDQKLSLLITKMQASVKIRDEYLEKFAACKHVDNTTRPQICSENENPTYFKLLRSFGQKFGADAFLNTSFNEKGLPMVGDPIQALIMFVRTDMDILVLDNYMIRKSSEI